MSNRITFLAAAAAALSGTMEKERDAAWSPTGYLCHHQLHYQQQRKVLRYKTEYQIDRNIIRYNKKQSPLSYMLKHSSLFLQPSATDTDMGLVNHVVCLLTLQTLLSSLAFIFRLHQMHEMPMIVVSVHTPVSLSRGSIRQCVQCIRGHLVQPLQDHFGLLFVYLREDGRWNSTC